MKIAFIKPKLGHKEDQSCRGKTVMEPHLFALLGSMTPLELEEGCANIRKQFFKLSSVIKRGLDIKTNLRSLKHAGCNTSPIIFPATIR
jgi:hypothetical protein